jgi:putative transposase
LKIEFGSASIPIKRQCELLGLPRSSYYYKAAGEDEEDIRLMSMIDREFTEHPFFGKRRICHCLRESGEMVNVKRVSRLMRRMGLEAVYPKPKLSRPEKWSEKYPYLLRGLSITRPDQVWASDITYIRLSKGFVYLVAVMDWFSRYVLSRQISTTLEVGFCVEALGAALNQGRPEIFNTDQGSQFTSGDFMEKLKGADIRISLDGRGRAFDNIMIERLWRSVKYEEVYLKDNKSVNEAKDGLSRYFNFYNEARPHQTLGYKTPGEQYHQDLRIRKSFFTPGRCAGLNN